MTPDQGRIRSLAAIFVPLACGYLLSYIFRTINGPLADELIRRFSLDAGSLGLLTSMYFLAFAVSAIPIGVALDALGPRRVQGWLMGVAAVGAIVFAFAPAAPVLIIGRFLIGLGVAGGLMAGLKAHALWVPPRYLPLANGGLVMFGGLGAIAATLPVGAIDAAFGWRITFVILAALSGATAIAIFALLPRHSTATQRQIWRDAPRGFIDAVTDRRFWRFAPLSASVVGTAFAIQGLWAARWLVDIEGYGSDQLLHELLAMGVGLTLGALAIGAATTWLRNHGVGETTVFGGFCIAFIALQVVLLLHVALPAGVMWGLIGGFGGMPVLSYSILDTMFPAERVGRANSALNVLHLTTAWLVQAGMGIVIAHWRADATGHYPIVAYRVAFLVPLVLQLAGLIWFFSPRQSGLARRTAKPLSPDGRAESARVADLVVATHQQQPFGNQAISRKIGGRLDQPPPLGARNDDAQREAEYATDEIAGRVAALSRSGLREQDARSPARAITD